VTGDVKHQSGRQQDAPVDAVRQECEQRRFDAEHGGAIADQRSGLRNVDRERAADLVDKTRRGEHACADDEVAEQQAPSRPRLSIIHVVCMVAYSDGPSLPDCARE